MKTTTNVSEQHKTTVYPGLYVNIETGNIWLKTSPTTGTCVSVNPNHRTTTSYVGMYLDVLTPESGEWRLLRSDESVTLQND